MASAGHTGLLECARKISFTQNRLLFKFNSLNDTESATSKQYLSIKQLPLLHKTFIFKRILGRKVGLSCTICLLSKQYLSIKLLLLHKTFIFKRIAERNIPAHPLYC